MTTFSKPKRRRNGKPVSNSAPSDRPSSNRRPTQSSRPSNRSGRKVSTLNPQHLVKRAKTVEQTEYRSERLFEDFDISPKLKSRLAEKGYTRPSEIQDKTFEEVYAGRDMLGIAQTGTGKTGAFLIPVIQQLIDRPQKNFALILVPTRELAKQVEDEFRSMSKDLGIYSASFIGGTNINKDFQILRRASHVVIATPGRLLDLVNRKMIDLRLFNTLILDEFDRMLDMGFAQDVRRVLNGMQRREQTLLFSATLDHSQKELIDSILTNPVTVKISSGVTSGDNIDQDIIELKNGENKFDVLCTMISNEDFQKVIVFEETKRSVSKLCDALNKVGIVSDQIHGNKSQNARQSALNAFKNGKIRVLVATDVAARGIDVSDVTHVINYRMPATYDSYIHRIGRTGRAGKTGKAYTFVA